MELTKRAFVCVAIHMKVLHTADFTTHDDGRIVFVARWVGDDAEFSECEWEAYGYPPRHVRAPTDIQFGDLWANSKQFFVFNADG